VNAFGLTFVPLNQYQRCTLQTVGFSIIADDRHYLENLFELLVYIVQAITTFVLSLALNHQRKYRGYVSHDDDMDDDDPLAPIYGLSHENRIYATPPLASMIIPPPPTNATLFGKPIPAALPGAPTEYDSLIRRSIPGSIYAVPATPIDINGHGVNRSRNSAAAVAAAAAAASSNNKRVCGGRRCSTVRAVLFSLEAVFFILFVIYLVGLYLKFANIGTQHSDVYGWIFFGVYLLQRIPPVILVMVIIMGGVCDRDRSSAASTRGPSVASRLILAAGSILNALNEMPAEFWVNALRNSTLLRLCLVYHTCDVNGTDELPPISAAGCVFYIASLFDMVNLLYGLSLVLYFIFLRAEYLRNMESCLWESIAVNVNGVRSFQHIRYSCPYHTYTKGILTN
jgi:hypothetical protein